MIAYSNSSVFGTDAQTITNTINCKGVMGAGIALEFKLRYPEMFEDYLQRCERQEVKTGHPYLFTQSAKWILNFPTKYDWRYPSRIGWIEEGLQNFAKNYKKEGIHSIAFPKLGTDKGGLDWRIVEKLMFDCLDNLDIQIYICLDKVPDTLEEQMIKRFNSLDSEDLLEAGISAKAAEKAISIRPVKRFRELISSKAVSREIYEKLHGKLQAGKVVAERKRGIDLIKAQTRLIEY